MSDLSTCYPELDKYVASLSTIPSCRLKVGARYGLPRESPAFTSRLSEFRIGSTPVTVDMWSEYCEANSLCMPEPPEWGWIKGHPIVNVSWHDIMGIDGTSGFCSWVTKVTGIEVSLPTEAQYECASWGEFGPKRDPDDHDIHYPWGEMFDDSMLWCSRVTTRFSTAPVDRDYNVYRNNFGLSDMSGNVWQWCMDLYGEYTWDEKIDPVGPPETPSNKRCIRGGSWGRNWPENFRCANREHAAADARVQVLGFRLAAEME